MVLIYTSDNYDGAPQLKESKCIITKDVSKKILNTKKCLEHLFENQVEHDEINVDKSEEKNKSLFLGNNNEYNSSQEQQISKLSCSTSSSIICSPCNNFPKSITYCKPSPSCTISSSPYQRSNCNNSNHSLKATETANHWVDFNNINNPWSNTISIIFVVSLNLVLFTLAVISLNSLITYAEARVVLINNHKPLDLSTPTINSNIGFKQKNPIPLALLATIIRSGNIALVCKFILILIRLSIC